MGVGVMRDSRLNSKTEGSKLLTYTGSEERGCGQSVGLYVVYIRERGGLGRGGCGF